jgi:hypothetical protein
MVAATSGGLTILAPGLLGPVPLVPEQAPPTPALDRLLARGRSRAGAAAAPLEPGLAAALLRRFQAPASAPFARAADEPDWDRHGFVLHAEPVHLRADRDRLRLFDARHLGISRSEADALVAEVNGLIASDGLELVAPVAGRWYLDTDTPPAIATAPLEQVIGRHIDGYLPSGRDAGRWAALMTEVQMLLFQSPVNREREARGRPTVNALWVHGGGQWRRLEAPAGLQRVCAEHPLADGLAEASGLERIEWDGLAPGPETLAVAAAMADGMLDADERSWAAAVADLEGRITAALEWLHRGSIPALSIDLCDGRCWQLDRRRSRRFWRRARPLAERVQTRPEG